MIRTSVDSSDSLERIHTFNMKKHSVGDTTNGLEDSWTIDNKDPHNLSETRKLSTS
jgi:hypothetical protein